MNQQQRSKTMLLLSLLILIPMIIAEKELRINDYIIKIDKHALKSIQAGPSSSNELNLSGLELETVDYGVFDNLINVERLDLANNSLDYVPSLISGNLQYLSVAENGGVQFDKAFINLPNLRTLNMSKIWLPSFGHGSLYGLSRSCDILTKQSGVIRISSAAFENPFDPNSQLALEENEEVWGPSSLGSDMMDHPPWDTSRHVKICINNGSVELVDFMEKDEILSAPCEIIKVDYKERLLSLVFKGIARFAKNWYRLGDFPIVKLSMSYNKIGRVTSELLNDLPANIKEVHLGNNEIERLENGTIENEHIVTLILTGNSINEIEDGTFEKTKIQVLHLEQNKFENTKFAQALPKTLTTLYAEKNKIAQITEDSFARLDQLETLDLHENDLTSIDTNSFRGLAVLKNLKLWNNALTNLQPGSFRHLKDLRYLELSDNRLSSLENGTFEGLDKLEKLDLGYNKLSNLTREMIRTLPANLSDLCLQANQITSLEAGVFVDVPKRILILDLNKITKIASGSFNLPNLEELTLRNNDLRKIDGDSFVGLASLKNLSLRDNGITIFDKEMLKNLGNLQLLDLSYNQITSFEVGKFINVPKNNLILVGNNISKIASGCFDLPTLKSLSLTDNHLSELDGDSFAGLPSLETLDLSRNSIAKIEKGAAKYLGNLRSLKLIYNPIKILKNGALFGLRKILGACWVNTSFTEIELIQGGAFDDV